MSLYERANTSTPAVSLSYSLLLAAFVAAIFISATLLFVVQPMFTKMVLPQLGGAASVWSTAMVFFQSVLLAGYFYPHLLVRFAPNRAGVIIHIALMIAVCAVLNIVAKTWPHRFGSVRRRDGHEVHASPISRTIFATVLAPVT
jgi:hypothetical protein